ncbi:MAG: metal ABC transporter permease [bacterium]|nr:metal ABC transporter permease [bacterium]
MSPQLEIVLLAVVVAAACALPGCLLVLRRMALMSDAISHSILLGIVLGFAIAGNLHSPLLILGAAVVGLLTVVLTETLVRTNQVKEDAAIGLVFPILFSLGVILITKYFSGIHLDIDAVLVGEIAYAPLDRLHVNGTDLGPRAMWDVCAVGLINLAFVWIFYKELKLTTFDPGLAKALGFMPGLLGYALMALVSLTTVVSFDAVGSILVVALMIAPPATAYLLCDRMSQMLVVSVCFGALAAISGYMLAHALDASIAGAMAVMCGVWFGLVLLLAPERGLISLWLLRRRQRWIFATHMLAIHLLQHEGTPVESTESAVRHMGEGLRWSDGFAQGVISHSLDSGLIQRVGEQLSLTGLGRETAREVLTRT